MAVESRYLGINAKTFALVVGIIGVAANAIYLIICSIQLAAVNSFDRKDLEDVVREQGGDEHIATIAYETIRIVLWVQIVLLVLGIIVSALLIVGAKKEKEVLLLPWIIIACITIGLSIYVVSSGMYTILRGQGDGSTIGSVLIHLVKIVIYFVFAKGIMVLRRELKNRPYRNPNVVMTNKV